MPPWQMHIDRGGTFTDLVGIAPDGRVHGLKVLSEGHPKGEDAALIGMRRLLGLGPGAPIPPGLVGEVRMGTTVATNALLTRSGAPLAFVVTQGHADALFIGHQARPDIFAREIRRPPPLYRAVLEVEERIDAGGVVALPLNEDAARRGLLALRRAGVEAVAICLLHATARPDHELRVGAIAEGLGFEEVVLSHRASPIPRFLRRAETATADAYLSPILRRYTEGLSARLGPGTPLRFMQSSGGLTAPETFRGKDALLSGPAGGIIGAVEALREEGVTRVVAFDMGGTSTDVSLVSGALPRGESVTVEGRTLWAPSLQIHTVASGGGSICAFDGALLKVGPASAGASPGPLSYQRGGPLTLTDCNVRLGRLQPDLFPRIFGPGGDQPLDAAAVEAAFDALGAEVGAALGEGDPEALAEGFLRLGVARMAEAVRTISLERGVDIRGHTLCAFGGAGGQHACPLADALGMGAIYIHPLAGLLSAFGMGLADHRHIRGEVIDAPLGEGALWGIRAGLPAMEAEAAAVVAASAGPGSQVSFTHRLTLCYAGAEASIEVELPEDADPEALSAAFEAAHLRRFGFTQAGAPLTLRALQVEAVAQSPRAVTSPPSASSEAGEGGAEDAPPRGHVWMRSAGQRVRAAVFDRGALRVGQRLPGPAMVVEETGTSIVDVGWVAEVRPSRALMLTRAPEAAEGKREGGPPDPGEASPSGAEGPADPLLLALYGHRFRAIAEEMGRRLQMTARSVNIKERLDFSCALFDGAGALIANAPHIPVHLGSMGESVRAVLRLAGARIAPGAAFAINDPYEGGTHLPDITVVSPIFLEPGAKASFFVASRGHHADVGGVTPGSMPSESRHIDEEGVRLRAVPLLEEGRFLEDALRACFLAGPHPARDVAQNLGDLKAQLAANRAGEDALRALVAEAGLPEVRAYMAHVRAYAGRSVARVLGRLTPGTFTCPLDDGGQITCTLSLPGEGRAVVDFTGTSGPSPLNTNAPRAVTVAAVLYAFRLLVDEDIPLNEGCLDPLKVIIPPGSLLDPHPPAAVVAGNVETAQILVDCILGAAGAMAASQGTMNNLTFGGPGGAYYETICGGAGAGPGFGGMSAVQTHMTNSRLTDPEVLERRFPVRVERFGRRRGSGGRGRHSGGDGALRVLRFLAPMEISLLSGRRIHAPHGLMGGGSGAPGVAVLRRARGGVVALGHRAHLEVEAGDLLAIETPGGGGYGRVEG